MANKGHNHFSQIGVQSQGVEFFNRNFSFIVDEYNAIKGDDDDLGGGGGSEPPSGPSSDGTGGASLPGSSALRKKEPIKVWNISDLKPYHKKILSKLRVYNGFVENHEDPDHTPMVVVTIMDYMQEGATVSPRMIADAPTPDDPDSDENHQKAAVEGTMVVVYHKLKSNIGVNV